jgi:hypothetical protein
VSECTVSWCDWPDGIERRTIEVNAPTSATVMPQRLRFDVELCPFHLEAFDNTRHTVLAALKPPRRPS